MKTAVIALKTKSDKASITTLAYQMAQITTKCIENEIRIVDCIITFGGVKDVIREVKKLDMQKRFEYLIIYSPTQLTQSESEFSTFVEEIEQGYQVEILTIRG